MNLFEEYFVRRQLRSPMIKRPEKTLNLICYAHPDVWRKSWLLLQIQPHRAVNNQHPAYYTFTWQVPRHNGLIESGRSFDSVGVEPKRVEWDEFEPEILTFCKQRDDLDPIANLAEAKMVAWEIFLYNIDDHIKTFPVEIRYKAHDCFNSENTIEQRMNDQEAVVTWMANNNNVMHSRWDTLRQYYNPQHYAVWLAEMAVRMRDQSFQNDFCDQSCVA